MWEICNIHLTGYCNSMSEMETPQQHLQAKIVTNDPWLWFVTKFFIHWRGRVYIWELESENVILEGIWKLIQSFDLSSLWMGTAFK